MDVPASVKDSHLDVPASVEVVFAVVVAHGQEVVGLSHLLDTNVASTLWYHHGFHVTCTHQTLVESQKYRYVVHMCNV